MPTLESFHSEIVQWRAEGKSLRVTAKSLQNLGLQVNHSAVSRYCNDAQIPAARPPIQPTNPPPGQTAELPSLFPPTPKTPSTKGRAGKSNPTTSPKPQTRTARTPPNTPYLQGVRARVGVTDKCGTGGARVRHLRLPAQVLRDRSVYLSGPQQHGSNPSRDNNSDARPMRRQQ